MLTTQTVPVVTPPDDGIDIIDAIEEALEISIADLVLNRVFVERHFRHQGLWVQGNKREVLLVLNYLILDAINAMDSFALKVLKIWSAVNTETNSMLITFRTNNDPPAPRALTMDARCVPSRKNGYCHWLEIARNTLDNHGGTILVHDQPGEGLHATIEFPIIAGSAVDFKPVCQRDAATMTARSLPRCADTGTVILLVRQWIPGTQKATDLSKIGISLY